jgi:hypothetical protein
MSSSLATANPLHTTLHFLQRQRIFHNFNQSFPYLYMSFALDFALALGLANSTWETDALKRRK